MIQKNNFTFIIRKETITCYSNANNLNQYILFNSWDLSHKRRFAKFGKVIKESQKQEYDNLNDIFGLATKYGIRACHGRKPTVTDSIAF